MKRRFYYLLLPVLILLAGCGRGGPICVPVSGKVMIDGVPLKTGLIRVVPDSHRPAVGTINENGGFTLTTLEPGDGCTQGTHKVEVIGTEKVDSGIHWLAPKKYAKAATSGLTIIVDKPTNQMQIDLTWDQGQPFVEKFNGAGDYDMTKLHGKANEK